MTPVEAPDGRRSFCARLKSERERRGTSLAAIAASTKIKASLLDALERGDLSRWPKGLYRRAFFKEYISAIGLPLEPTLSDFTDLFSDSEAPRSLPSVGAAPDPDALRLFLAPEPAVQATVRAPQDVATRLTAAIADIIVMLAVARLASAFVPFGIAPVALTLVTLCFLATSTLGVGPALWVWTQSRSRRPSDTTALPLPLEMPTATAPLISRVVGTIQSGQTLLIDYADRIAASELTTSRQRRRDLASLRRQRVEAANRTGDELVV
jgi:hypothetical protein